MIIKNTAQLISAEARKEAILNEVEEYNGYTGIQYEFYVRPLLIVIQELTKQINEFKKLTCLPFEQAISDVLSEPILIDNIGDLLAKLRVAAKMTQAEMANLLGWEQSNLSRFENENYSSQTINKIVEFVSALGIYLHVTPSLTDEPEQPEDKIKIGQINLEDITSTDTTSFRTIDGDVGTYAFSTPADSLTTA